MLDGPSLGSLQAQPVEQFAVEALVDGQVVTREPTRSEPSAFDPTGGRGPVPRPQTREVVVSPGTLDPDPSFEELERYWIPGHYAIASKWTSAHVYSGKVAVDLSVEEGKTSLISTNFRGSQQLAPAPNAVYEVTYWAKCIAGEGEVNVNFYYPDRRYDFLHVVTPVPADGEWHHVRVEVPTGEFPAPGAQGGVFLRSLGLTPALRLWTIDKPQRTYVDHVEVKRLR